MSKVDIEIALDIQRRRNKINDIEVSDLELYKNGKKIDIDPEKVKQFEFIGLSTMDFIISEYYK